MKRIMVVDDDTDLLLAMKSIIRKAGYEVRVTTSCEEGLSILTTFKPDLIYLDIEIGTGDGRKMCRQIKSLAGHKHIPVILFSANYEALNTYADFGADDTMRKPFEPFFLLKQITTHLPADL